MKKAKIHSSLWKCARHDDDQHVRNDDDLMAVNKKASRALQSPSYGCGGRNINDNPEQHRTATARGARLS